MVTIALPNSLEWFATFVAAWKLGATPQPVSARLPARELGAIVALAGPKVVVGAIDGATADAEGAVDGDGVPVLGAAAVRALVDSAPPAGDGAADPLPDVMSPAWKAPTSGGSTGRPKLIVSGDPAEIDADAPPRPSEPSPSTGPTRSTWSPP